MKPSLLFRPWLVACVALGLSCCSSDEGGSGEGAGGEGGAAAASASTAGGDGGMAGAASGGAGGVAPPVTSDPNDPFACTGPSQCLLVDAARDCCVPKCGEKDVSFFTAIHADHNGTWYEGQICAGCLEPCSDPERKAFADSTRSIIAVCNEAGRCEARDVMQSDISACDRDEQCVLRWGLQCCEDRMENLDLLTAVSNKALLTDLTCPEVFTNCGPIPSKPPEARAICGADGRCAVTFGSSDGGVDAGDPGSTPTTGDAAADAPPASDGG